MIIKWSGQSCFHLAVNPSEKVNIIIDPNSAIKADIFLISQGRALPKKVAQKASFLIEGPGEYEIKKVFFQGISASEGDAVYYTIEGEGIRLCHLNGLTDKLLTDEQLEEISRVDILMIKTGPLSQKIISQVEPAIVIPMYEKADLDKFLKTMGQKSIEPEEKLVIKHKDLPKEGMEIVVLKPTGKFA